LKQVSWQENIEDASTEADSPVEESEVPELSSGGCAIDLECLVQCGEIGIQEVLHGAMLPGYSV
jgi:hypothetical protein